MNEAIFMLLSLTNCIPLFSYQFLEDAYTIYKQHMENLTQQLQEKKKLISEVENSINTGYVVLQYKKHIQQELKQIKMLLLSHLHRNVRFL